MKTPISRRKFNRLVTLSALAFLACSSSIQEPVSSNEKIFKDLKNGLRVPTRYRSFKLYDIIAASYYPKNWKNNPRSLYPTNVMSSYTLLYTISPETNSYIKMLALEYENQNIALSSHNEMVSKSKESYVNAPQPLGRMGFYFWSDEGIPNICFSISKFCISFEYTEGRSKEYFESAIGFGEVIFNLNK